MTFLPLTDKLKAHLTGFYERLFDAHGASDVYASCNVESIEWQLYRFPDVFNFVKVYDCVIASGAFVLTPIGG